MAPPPPELPDHLLGEAFLRLPPDDPACLLRASLVCKRWRRILANPAFRLRHRALYPAPSVVGFVRVVSDEIPYCSSFVPENPASGRPAGRDLPGWLALDCRHGRALFVTPAAGQDTEEEGVTLDFVVWDPLTDERHLLPPPSLPTNFRNCAFNAAVLCAAASGSCDHRGCHGAPFRVVFVFTTWVDNTGLVTSASVYSSETGVWSGLTSVQLPDSFVEPCPCTSALVGDTLYFCGTKKKAFEYQLGVQRLSVIDWPWHRPGQYMTSVEGKLGFFNVEEEPSLSLCLWSQETAPSGDKQWARSRIIKLETPLPREALRLTPPNQLSWLKHRVIGFAEGTDVILLAVPTHGFECNVYMAELKPGRAKKIIEGLSTVYPYTSFSIPVIDSGSTGEGPEKGASGV